MTTNIFFNQKMNNFASSVAKHALNGFASASDKTKQERLDICKSCDQYKESPLGPQCQNCGCLLNVKTGWASEQCPLKKWLAEKTTVEHQQAPPPQSNCGSCNKE